MPAKTRTEPTEEEASQALVPIKADVTELFGTGTLAFIQQEYGVTAADISAPVPATPIKNNLDQLCVLKDRIIDQYGNEFEEVNGHSGPLMFLEKTGEYDGAKFEGYDGFHVYAIAHPSKGKVIVTIGRPIGEKDPAIVAHLNMLNKGQVFQVASFATSKGFRVFNPIPVQKDGKLIEL